MSFLSKNSIVDWLIKWTTLTYMWLYKKASLKEKITSRIAKLVYGDQLSNIGTTTRDRRIMLNKVMDFIRLNLIDGDYLEFGVFEGTSFIDTYKLIESKIEISTRSAVGRKMLMFGFDSFKGLPKISKKDTLISSETYKNKKKWVEGQMNISQKDVEKLFDSHYMDNTKYKLISGFYKDKLTKETLELLGIKKSAIVNIDCDLYDSTLTALNFIKPTLQTGTILIMDDYFHFRGDKKLGEAGALNKFLKDNPNISVVSYLQYGVAGKVFIVNIN